MKKIVLVLDAMGVIYHSADDVLELLAPFVKENGGLTDIAAIEKLYTQASLGELTAEQFWEAAGVPADLEGEYLAKHRLSEGLVAFFEALPSSVSSVWCLSNDVSQWSRVLRERYRLTQHIAGFVISGDVRSRKPEARIYQALLAQVGRPAEDCVFVDDRIKNLDAAKSLGFRTVLFAPAAVPTPNQQHHIVKSFSELASHLETVGR